MNEVQFENWKQFITENLARTTVTLDLMAAETKKMAAEAEERARALDRRMDASDRRMERLERNLVQLAVLGRRARSRLDRRQEEHAANMAKIELTLLEMTDKLNGLIGHQMGQNPPKHSSPPE